MTVNHEKFHLKEVINASGKMTILGVSTVSENVLAAQRFGGEHFFEMDSLVKETGAFIANLLQVEAAQIISCASAGIAQSVAAVIGQGSLYHVYHPYSEKITKREILLPKGHNVCTRWRKSCGSRLLKSLYTDALRNAYHRSNGSDFIYKKSSYGAKEYAKCKRSSRNR